MKYTLITLAALSGSAFAQTIVNSSFENPSGLVTDYQQVGTNYWTGWTDGGTGSLQNIVNFGGLPASDGAQWVDFAGTGKPSLEQDFATTAGQRYTITFDRGVWGDQDVKTNSLRVQVGNLDVVDLVTATGPGMNWVTNSYDFIAAGTSTNLKFTFESQDGGGLAGLDNIRITTAVPEPSSTALLGLGGLALILRRRK